MDDQMCIIQTILYMYIDIYKNQFWKLSSSISLGYICNLIVIVIYDVVGSRMTGTSRVFPCPDPNAPIPIPTKIFSSSTIVEKMMLNCSGHSTLQVNIVSSADHYCFISKKECIRNDDNYILLYYFWIRSLEHHCTNN